MQKTDIAEGINSLLLIHVLYIAFAWIILLWGLREWIHAEINVRRLKAFVV